jgi:hypothetical protein
MCGLADNASRLLQLSGLKDTLSWSTLTKKRINEMINQIYRRSAKDIDKPVFAIPAVDKLNALCLWVSYHVVQGLAANFDSITTEILNQHVTRFHIIESEIDKAKVDKKKKAPGNFETFNAAKFIIWEESFNQYLRLHRSNTSKTLLEYLIRPIADVSPEVLVKEYESIDDDLIATHKMEGPAFQQDNQWLVTEILHLVLKGSAATQFVATARNDGRGMFLILKGIVLASIGRTHVPLRSVPVSMIKGSFIDWRSYQRMG